MTASVFESELVIPGYVCEGLIGRGGMGSVYRAIQLGHKRPVAVKVLGEAFRDDPGFVARFRREAELLATIEHPHIVPLLDSGEADGVPFIVMRLIDGPNLRDLIRLGVPAATDAIHLLSGVATALDFAHARGVLHCDVKPHNMLLDHGGHVWLADFGLTKLASQSRALSVTNSITGTFDYLAPELAAGRTATTATDIYALAVSAFQLLTGTLPFAAEHAAGLLQAHAAAPRPAASGVNPGLPAKVDFRLAEGMAVDPATRPSTAAAFVDGLADALEVSERPRPPALAMPGFDRSGAPEQMSVLTSAETHPGLPPAVVLRRRRWGLRSGVALLAAGLAVLCGLTLLPAPHRATASTVQMRTLGASTNTFYNYAHPGSHRGPVLPARTRVDVSCRLTGRPISGEVWWYRIASMPWDQQFYAPAADFDNGMDLDRLRPYTPSIAVCEDFAEVPGNRLGTYTWTNFRDAGGTEGRKLAGFAPARVLCRVRGLKVQDGNVWWYRIGGRPWDGRFYASADAFYNNGETHGTLRGTGFVDPNVPLCNNTAD